MIVVRPALVTDAEAMSDVLIASITALCISDHQNRPETVSRWLANKSSDGVRRWFGNPDNRLLIAERDGALAAVGGINTAREVTLNYVAPEHRFAGVTTTLLDAMEAALGPGEARLNSTETAHRFHLGRGWRDVGAPSQWAGMVAYPMRKLL